MLKIFSPISPCNVYFLGGGDTGSWKIRGEQIASTRRNWRCGDKINKSILNNYDIIVAVKRVRPDDAATIKDAGCTLVLDVIDSWHNPPGAKDVHNAEDARRYFASKWENWLIDSAIFANRKMYEDLHTLVPHSTYIYHHYYPKLKPIRLRPNIRLIGYQGRIGYLGEWESIIQRVAEKHGLRFVVNPSSLMDLDLGFIARGGDSNGYMEQNYKSNVKLANMMACGIPPLMLSDNASYLETWARAETYFTSESELDIKLTAMLESKALCESIHFDLIEKSKSFKLEAIALQYETYFSSLPKA